MPLVLVLPLALLATLPLDEAGAQQPSAKATQQPAADQGTVTLNFVNVDIAAVARAMADMLQHNIVLDPRVKGQMTLTTENPVSVETAYLQFMAALRLSGYTMVRTGDLYKVIPEADAKLQGDQVVTSANRHTAAGQVVTQIFPLHHADANALVPVLRPLIGPNNTINVNPASNSLVITDYAENLARISRIIGTLDVPNATGLDVVPLQYAIASEVAPLLQQLLDGDTTTAKTGGTSRASNNRNEADAVGSVYPTTILTDPRTNSLLIRAANSERLALARSLVAKLDIPPAAGSTEAGNIHVVYLRNANAESLAQTLRGTIGQSSGTSTSSQSSGPASGLAGINSSTTSNSSTSSTSSSTSSSTGTSSGSAISGNTAALGSGNSASNGASNGGQIQADVSTNSLIITAPEPQYRQLRAVIDQLDTRRAQIYIEALIAEVTSSDGASLGVQWLGLNGSNAIGGTNFGSTGNLNTVAYEAYAGAYSSISLAQGLNLGFYNGSFAALINALRTQSNTNILSTPTVMTLDNQEARILVGQNIPISTGSYTSTSSTSTYTTYQRMDVGVMLDVKPQISADGTIKLDIYQEVSSVDDSSSSSSSSSSDTSSTGTYTINKRSIASTVLVQGGSTLVLGGLMQDETASTNYKVPLLGDIPFLGQLFRSQSRTRTKTNLMVFLRPVVLRSEADSNDFSRNRYEEMRAFQNNEHDPVPNWMPAKGIAVLPEQSKQPAPPVQVQSATVESSQNKIDPSKVKETVDGSTVDPSKEKDATDDQ
ncbi:MAG: type II secretion system secretin GspD [Pseudoxanthomonas sp.]